MLELLLDIRELLSEIKGTIGFKNILG